ncbi:MAG: peptidoglycan DD-metalloendopeptidase family protein [Clostridiales bacterium]|nr:peptidoglycan DD-metalloendopeptidase family protein [Clostridiales bacterium]
MRFSENVVLQKRLIAGGAVVLTAALGVGAFSSRANASDSRLDRLMIRLNADTEDDLETARNDRADAEAAAADARAQADSLQGQKDQLTGELAELQGLSDEQWEQYQIIAQQYALALEAKVEAYDTYLDAQDNLEETKEMFSERVSTMFEYRNKSTLEVLLESDSIAGFFTNMEIITLIADADDQAVDEMQIALDYAEAQSEYALQEAEDMQVIAEEKQEQLQELEDRIGVTEAALEDISVSISTYNQMAAEFDAESAALGDQILALQAELDAQNATPTPEPQQQDTSSDSGDSGDSSDPTPVPAPTAAPVSNGTLSWPTWSTTIRDYFGERVHPITGETRMHYGLDIGANFGDSVMAAGSGTVIYVEEPVEGENYGGSGYGNYCIVDHGNGITTVYGHMRDVYVSTGDSVSTGTVLGEVGSTGGSTGPHLHFEVREWGTAVDPLGYL